MSNRCLDRFLSRTFQFDDILEQTSAAFDSRSEDRHGAQDIFNLHNLDLPEIEVLQA